jgi:hypothetical protein
MGARQGKVGTKRNFPPTQTRKQGEVELVKKPLRLGKENMEGRPRVARELFPEVPFKKEEETDDERTEESEDFSDEALEWANTRIGALETT